VATAAIVAETQQQMRVATQQVADRPGG